MVWTKGGKRSPASVGRQRRRFRERHPERSAAYDLAMSIAPLCPTCRASMRPIIPWQAPYALQGWRCFGCRGKEKAPEGAS